MQSISQHSILVVKTRTSIPADCGEKICKNTTKTNYKIKIIKANKQHKHM
jgi:hypothetical protein